MTSVSAWFSRVSSHGLVDQRMSSGSTLLRSPMTRMRDAGLVQLGEIAADEALHQPHQVVDLLGRARPVLGREAVEREVAGCRDRSRRAPCAAPPRRPCDGRPSAAGRAWRPAAVAVHDDGDVARHRRRSRSPSRGGFVESRHAAAGFRLQGHARIRARCRAPSLRPCGSRFPWPRASRRSL